MDDINKEKYYAGSAKFRDLASKGLLDELELHVYKQEDPYILYVPSKSRLARNVLSFFCSNNHKEAVDKFFKSYFMTDISHMDLKDGIKGIYYNDNIEIFNIIMSNYNQKFTDKDMEEFLNLANDNKAIKIIKKILEEKDANLTQEQQMDYFLKLLSSKESDKTLIIFHLLENKFQDIKYHQQDDILMRAAIANKQNAVINHLLFAKKLRITKHINALSWCDSEFSQLVQKRKLFDSMERKSQNHLEKRKELESKSIHNSIQKSIKKI